MSQPSAPESTGRSAQRSDAAVGYRLRVGHATLPATTTFGALRAAVERSNGEFRTSGLPDRLNPDVIDVDKATALVAALPAIVQRSPQLLAGRELLLSHADLRIGAADPTTADAFSHPFDLEIADVQGDTLLARATVPVVPQLARERAAEARARLAAENERIAPLEGRLDAAGADVAQQRAILEQLTPARWRRSALARVWWSNAREASQAASADAAAKADLEAARRALDAYLLPGGVGMPR
jgi:hypothetical protein